MSKKVAVFWPGDYRAKPNEWAMPQAEETTDDPHTRIDRQALKATVVSIEGGVVKARIEGNLTMRRTYTSGKPDPNEEDGSMRIVDLSMTVEECDSAPFAKDEYYFKLRPIVTWEEKGFVSNLVEMTVHAGTHIDSPHHFFRHMPGVEQIPLDSMIGEAIKSHRRRTRPDHSQGDPNNFSDPKTRRLHGDFTGGERRAEEGEG